MTTITFPLRPPRLVLLFAGGDGKTMSIKIKYIYQNMGVEIIDSKVETWSRGRNSRLPFDVNVMLNLSIVLKKITTNTPSHGTQLKLNCS